MRTSEFGRRLIKEHEGLRLSRYKDPVGKDTIGWGHLIREADNIQNEITLEEAESLLDADLLNAEGDVHKLVTVELNQKQFDALVSLVFNIGGGALAGSRKTLPIINSGEYSKVPQAIMSWNKGRKKDPISGTMKLVELPGLTRRRKAEAALFAEGTREMFGA